MLEEKMMKDDPNVIGYALDYNHGQDQMLLIKNDKEINLAFSNVFYRLSYVELAELQMACAKILGEI